MFEEDVEIHLEVDESDNGFYNDEQDNFDMESLN